MLGGGYLSIGRWRGAPVRLHWTLPLGALVFGQLELVPAYWLAFAILIFVHELGHAVVVDRCRQRVVSIDIHGFGGACRWAGSVTPMQRALIAWGGVLGQLALLLGTRAAVLAFGEPTTAFQHHVAHAFVMTNVILMALNLLPIPPLDGVEAWRIVPLLAGRARQARARSLRRREAKAAARREVAALRAGDDEEVQLTPEVKAVVDDLLGRHDPRRRGRG
ncbi:MAG: hypothetical protein IT372_18355 [Polyangiaceae bacterium]|nr:hypothetical protein [Polyangiaceae bacterium]